MTSQLLSSLTVRETDSLVSMFLDVAPTRLVRSATQRVVSRVWTVSSQIAADPSTTIPTFDRIMDLTGMEPARVETVLEEPARQTVHASTTDAATTPASKDATKRPVNTTGMFACSKLRTRM